MQKQNVKVEILESRSLIVITRQENSSAKVRSKIFPRGRIKKQTVWDAPNIGEIYGLAEVWRAVLNSVVEFLMFKVRWVLK